MQDQSLRIAHHDRSSLDQARESFSVMTRPIDRPWEKMVRSLQDLAVLAVIWFVIVGLGRRTDGRCPTQSPRSGKAQESEDRPGGGIAVQSQVLRIWLPEAFVEMSKRDGPTLAARIR
jgi:hypothetical protein